MMIDLKDRWVVDGENGVIRQKTIARGWNNQVQMMVQVAAETESSKIMNVSENNVVVIQRGKIQS